ARGEGVAKDEVQALMWTILAANQGLKRAVDDRAYLAKGLSPENVAQAEKLAANWKPTVR
ncbi:MAG: sel1 repeat family protein, partial [Rhodospirillaceae bacterium]|nr:sel1 repeat family protein [Rhodospirillaceae bacterium]